MAIWSRDEFVSRLRAVGAKSYHDKHPFHRRMNAGELSPEEIRRWVLNRFYYQRNIPIKDAALLSNCPEQAVRRVWLHRIIDHDGQSGAEGGIQAWLRLGAACGVASAEMLNDATVLPGVREAVDSYVEFARREPWPVAIASSLTELFAPDLMSERLRAFEKFYTWISPDGFDYFRRRLTQAKTDSDEALTITLQYCTTPELQQDAVAALQFKCELLWKILESIAASPLDSDAIPRLSPHARIQTDPVTGKPMLLFPEGAAALNDTAQQIVKLCDGSRSVKAIAETLAAEYQQPRAVIEASLQRSIARLSQQGLIEWVPVHAPATR